MLNELSVDQTEKCISANDPKAFSCQRNPGFNPHQQNRFSVEKMAIERIKQSKRDRISTNVRGSIRERNAVWQNVRKHYNPFYSKTCPILSQCCFYLKASYFKRFQIFDLLLRKNYHQVLWKISRCGHTERESFQVFGVHLLLLSDFPVKEQLQVLHKTYFRSFNFVIKRLLNVQLILNPFLFSFFLLSLSPSLSIYSSIGCPFQPNFDSLFIPKRLVY